MAGLRGKSIANAYKSLLRVNDDTNGVDTTVAVVTDGAGTKSCFWLSDDVMLVKPDNDNGTATFRVSDASNNVIFNVDTTNSKVKAGTGQFNVLTQYAYFSAHYSITTSNTAGYHYPLNFGHGKVSALADQVTSFGNSVEPATSVTTADASDQRAAEIVNFLMYVPDNIEVNEVTSLEGADAAAGDTTRFHLMSYTLNSGSTSCLEDGTLIAHSTDQTNSGSEQIYKNTWTIDSASVAGGKVLVCTFEADGNSSDYSYNVVVKYNLV